MRMAGWTVMGMARVSPGWTRIKVGGGVRMVQVLGRSRSMRGSAAGTLVRMSTLKDSGGGAVVGTILILGVISSERRGRTMRGSVGWPGWGQWWRGGAGRPDRQ